ncbi:MAG: glycosyltransferase [Akkermansiaceae bacterium]|nr:glycosyltransferase [Akkermansiaceae bacterium]
MENFWFNLIWLLAYFLVLVCMSGYGVHRLLMVVLYLVHRRHVPQPEQMWDELPVVTVQLPMFNERYVVEGLLRKVTAIDYPKDKLEIQILDDSTDDTWEICKQQVEKYKKLGFDIKLLHRVDRTGYKAGALEAANEKARGEFLLILDADFRPDPDILRVVIPYFTDEKVALVQTRWGHINRNKNLLTRLQSIFLDGHFALEQTVRNRSGRFFTFNGTAGVWRKAAIADAGGWEHDTITEDMDLSYRAQIKGWRFVYLNDYVTRSELPEDMDGFKTQQHRWTKGCIQVCRKMLFPILRAKIPLKAKLEAVTHLTCNFSYLGLILLCVLVMPICTGFVRPTGAWDWQEPRMMMVTFTLFFLATVTVCTFYVVAEAIVRPKRWWMVFPLLLPLLALGVGMAVNNARAVLEALFSRSAEFVRTPKFGESGEGKLAVEQRARGYRALKSVLVPLVELAFGMFFLSIEVINLYYGLTQNVLGLVNFILMSPFLGFFYTGASSAWRLIQSTKRRRASAG